MTDAVMSRWAKEKMDQSDDEFDEHMLGNDNDSMMDVSDSGSLVLDSSDDEETNRIRSLFKDNIDTNFICDIFQLCKEKCSLKDLSVLIYLSLRSFKIPYEEINIFLKEIGALTAQVAHKWATVFVSDDLDQYFSDGRGGKRVDSLYDIYPDLELEGKAFVAGQCQQKSSSFTVMDLAKFIDEKFYEISDEEKTGSDLVRSIESCRLDLRHWGARFEANSQRPFFEGHERPDVTLERGRFIDYFIDNKHSYYTVSSEEDPKWITPKVPRKKILICKKESLNNLFLICAY